jgi:tetratricopeptide (TPR) repeat protein
MDLADRITAGRDIEDSRGWEGILMSHHCSVCVIARNEQSTLPRCLESVTGLVDEMILVDTGSNDRTKELAAGLGAQVFDFPWCDSFAAARNECLKHATSQWILTLDADDFLDENNRQKLRRLLDTLREKSRENGARPLEATGGQTPFSGQTPFAYVLRCLCLPDGLSNSGTVVDHVRLFRNHPEIRWKYRVHEQILPAIRRLGGEVRWTDIVIKHTGYLDPVTLRKKQERNRRLLEMDYAEHPDDPFVLFNLGWLYQGLGRQAEAVPLLQKSLERSDSGDSITRKLHVLLAQCYERLGRPELALAQCRSGLARYPDDAELLFWEGKLLGAAGDLDGAERCWRRLVRAGGQAGSADTSPKPERGEPLPTGDPSPKRERRDHSPSLALRACVPEAISMGALPLGMAPVNHFGSADAGLHGATTRHHLAMLYQRQGRQADAEAEWRLLLREQPAFAPAWFGLGELFLAGQRWPELEELATELEKQPALANEVPVLRARGHLARQEFAGARGLLEALVARQPQAVHPRIILSHALLQEHRDLAAAERVLRELLELDPRQAESWRNLAILFREQGRGREALEACRAGRIHCPDDLRLLLLSGIAQREAGDFLNAESCLVRFLERVGSGPASPLRGSGCQPDTPTEAGRLGNLPHAQTARERSTARHNLALIYRERKRAGDAEVQWRAVLAEDPAFLAAWLGLADLCLEQGRWPELEQIIGNLQGPPHPQPLSPEAGARGVPLEAAVLRGRLLLAGKEFRAAEELLRQTITDHPRALWPRVILSHVLLQEGRDLAAAEQALHDILALDPHHAEARRNLAVLRRQQVGAPA